MWHIYIRIYTSLQSIIHMWSIHIYIYIYVILQFIIHMRLYIYIYIYLIKQYRQILSTYLCICPFQLPHWFYGNGIWWELVDENPITNCFSSTFSPILGHHQGCVYSKSDLTFACTLLLCKYWLFILVCCCSVLFVSIRSSSI